MSIDNKITELRDICISRIDICLKTLGDCYEFFDSYAQQKKGVKEYGYPTVIYPEHNIGIITDYDISYKRIFRNSNGIFLCELEDTDNDEEAAQYDPYYTLICDANLDLLNLIRKILEYECVSKG